jgi:hypothetical protein
MHNPNWAVNRQGMTGKFFSVFPFSLAYPLEPVFFFSNWWSRWIGNHGQEDTAPIWQEVKEGVRKTWDSPHKAATCWNLMSKYGSFSFFPLMMWRVEPISTNKKHFIPFVVQLFAQEVVKIWRNKRHIEWKLSYQSCGITVDCGSHLSYLCTDILTELH